MSSLSAVLMHFVPIYLDSLFTKIQPIKVPQQTNLEFIKIRKYTLVMFLHTLSIISLTAGVQVNMFNFRDLFKYYSARYL